MRLLKWDGQSNILILYPPLKEELLDEKRKKKLKKYSSTNICG